MHTTQLKTCRIHHNGDFDGMVTIRDSKGSEVEVDFDDLKSLVAEKVRRDRISKLEDASDDKLLGTE